MSHPFMKSALLALAFVSSSCFAGLYGMDSNNVRPYVGVDIANRDMGFEEPFGEGLFEKNLGQYDVYAGIKFFKYVGLQIGYQETENERHHYDYAANDAFLGLVLPFANGRDSEVKVKGWHADIVGFYPICPRYKVELFASAGLVRNKLVLTETQVTQGNLAIDPIARNYSVKDTHARFTAGVQKTFMDHFGVKASIAWEDTSDFGSLKPSEAPNAQTSVRSKNSLIYGIGIFAII